MSNNNVNFIFSSNLKTQFDPDEIETMTISKFLAFAQKISEDTDTMEIKNIPITKVVLTPTPKI